MMKDPVEEVEERVERIIEEHRALWGCDDPVCALQQSNMMLELEETMRPTWWQRVFLRRKH